MPNFTVTVKGKQYTIEGPEGSTQAEAQTQAESYLGGAAGSRCRTFSTVSQARRWKKAASGGRRTVTGDILGGIGRGLSASPEEVGQSSFLQRGGGLPLRKNQILFRV